MLISHRMPDVFAVSDRIIVMRRGTKVADKAIDVDIAGRNHRPDHGSDPCSMISSKTSETGHAAIADVVGAQGTDLLLRASSRASRSG